MEGHPEVRGPHRIDEVFDRKDASDDVHPPRWVVRRDEDPGQEQQRQDDRVDDRRTRVLVRNDAAHREADRCEAAGPTSSVRMKSSVSVAPGIRAPYAMRPNTTVIATNRKPTNVACSTRAVRYDLAGNGVPRRRFRSPPSLAYTTEIAMFV